MATWWFFRDVKYTASITEQAKVASSYVKDNRFWIGAHPDASRRKTTDIKKIIYTKELEQENKPKGKYPIHSQDEVWVYNIFCLGYSAPDILETLEYLNHENVSIHIYSLETSDTPMIQIFKELSVRSEEFSRQKKKPVTKNTPGRNKVIFHYADLPDCGSTIIDDYCNNPLLSKEEAYIKFNNPINFPQKNGKPIATKIGRKKFNVLVSECNAFRKLKKKPIYTSWDRRRAREN